MDGVGYVECCVGYPGYMIMPMIGLMIQVPIMTPDRITDISQAFNAGFEKPVHAEPSLNIAVLLA